MNKGKESMAKEAVLFLLSVLWVILERIFYLGQEIWQKEVEAGKIRVKQTF